VRRKHSGRKRIFKPPDSRHFGFAADIGKGAWKLGSNTWGATRKWLGKNEMAEPGQEVHHWLIPQGGWGESIPDMIKNQPWNLMPMESQAFHNSVHGIGKDPFGLLGRYWYGSPDWAKAAAGSVGGRAIDSGRGGGGAGGCN